MHTEGTTPQEATQARKLVAAILATGASVTVNNGGEENEIEHSIDNAAILAAIGEAGEDTITAYMEGRRMGVFYLVWGNAEDGSELIADYIVNAWSKAIIATVERI